MSRVIIPVEANMSKADAQMAAFARNTSDLLEKKGFKLNIRKPDLPLGRITGDFEKFQGSLDAATARVLAFTATTTVIYGLSTAFTRLFTDSVKLEKQLAGIQAILNTSNSNLQQFGSDLFKLANATGQSFDVAAEAASEFARQGLSLEETLKATNAALVFSKIAGVDAAQAVENLTASINTFGNEALSYTDVVDTIVSLDNAFAISAGGIADGLKRVGSVASESGIQLKEIASLISVVQQVSARGAPVISNGLKTIFTRLSRTSVQDALNDIGVATKNSNGDFRSQIDVLTDLSNRLDSLSDSQRAFVLEQVAGVYQINTLQATLKSLNGEYSLFDKAVKVASDSAGNSAERLKILTDTTDANLQRLRNNVTQFLAETGKATVKPLLDNFVGIGNKILESLNLGAAVKGGEEAGFSIGNVLLNGISAVISGPGAAIIVVTIARLLNKITKDALSALQTLAGLKKASLLDTATQNSINQAIAQGNQGLVNRLATTNSIVEKMLILDKLLTNQTTKLGIAQINQAVSTGLAANKANVPAKGKGRSKGYMPNYALGNIPSSVPQAQEPIPPEIRRKEKMDSLKGRYKSGEVVQVPEGYMSTAEIRDKIPGGGPNPWILPPLTQDGKPVKAGEDFREKAIRTKGIDPYKALGFIPNFAFNIGDFTGDRGVNNPRAREQFLKGQMNPNVEWDDKINSVGFRVVKIPVNSQKTIGGVETKTGRNLFEKNLRDKKGYRSDSKYPNKSLTEKNRGDAGITQKFEDFAISYLNKTGYSFKKGSVGLFGKSNSAVDGYDIKRGGSAKTNRVQLLEVKGGDWSPADVNNKFGRFIPENINILKSSLSPLFEEGVPDKFDKIRQENILAVPDLKKGIFERDIKNRYKSSSLADIEKARQMEQRKQEVKRERKKATEDAKNIKQGLPVKPKKPLNNFQLLGKSLLKAAAPIRAEGFIPNFVNPFTSLVNSSAPLRNPSLVGLQAVPPPAQSSRIILPPKVNRNNNTGTGTQNNSNPRGNKEIAIDIFKGFIKAGAMVYARDGMLGDALTGGPETDILANLIKGNAKWAAAWMGAKGVNKFVADAAKNGLRVAGSLRKALTGRNRTSAAGFIPNFSSPLSYTQERKAVNESIGAEMTSGYKRSEVYVGRRASLKTDLNPQGLAVFNKDEGTLSKGMSFAKMAKEDPTTKRTYGDSSSRSESITSALGFIPNFATAKEIRAQKRRLKIEKARKAQENKVRIKEEKTQAAQQKVAAQKPRPALPTPPSRLGSGLGGSFQATREIFEKNPKRGNTKFDYLRAKKQMAKLPQTPGRYQPTLTAQNQFVDRKEILKNLTQDRINKGKVGGKGGINDRKSAVRNRKYDSIMSDRLQKRSMAAGIMTPGGKLGSPILPTKGIQGAGKGMQGFPRTQIENRFQVEKDARKAKADTSRRLNNEGRSIRKEYGADFAKQKELNASQKGGISQGGAGQQGVNKQGAMPAGGGMPMGAGLPASDTQATKTPAQLKLEKKELRATRASAMSTKAMGAAFVASSVTGMLTTPEEGKEQTKGQKIGQNVGEAIATGASVAMGLAMVPALAPVVVPLALLAAGLKFAHKAAKDSVPSTVELTKNNKKLSESTESQIASVQEAVKAQGEISQLRESGGDPKKIAQAQARFNKSLGGIKDKELVSTLVNEKSDIKKQEAIMTFQEKKTKELNFSTGNLATNEIIKKSRQENTGIFGTKTKTTDFKTEDWDTFLNPIIDSIDFTKAKSKEASAAIGKLGDGTMSMGDFISQFGSELGLSESQVKMANKTYGDLNTQFSSSSIQAMEKYAASLLDLNKTINETANQKVKGFSLDFQKVFDEGLKGLTLDTALINYQKFSKAGTNLGIDKNRLEIAKSSGSITEAQSITKSAEIETRQLGLENEKAGTTIVSDAVSKLTALVPKDASIEQRSAILDKASSVLKGGGDLSSLENLIKQSLGAGDSSKEILSQIADINQDVVLGIEKLRIDQAEGVRSINAIAQDQLKESQRRSVAEIGKAALAGPPKYTNKLMNTGAVMETDAKIQKLRDQAEKSGGAKSSQGRKLLLEASNLEMQNDRVKYEDELAQAERYGKDNVVKRTNEGKSGAAQIQKNMAEDIGNKLRSLNASREKSGKAGIFSNEDIKKISEGIQIGGEGATESKRLLEEKLNNPSYAQDATVQGFAREIKDVGGKNSIFAGNAMAAAVSGPEKSLAQATGVPTIPTGPSVPSVTAGATAPVVAGTAAAGGGAPTLPNVAAAAGAGAAAAVPAAIDNAAMNPSSAALPNYASSTANMTARSLTGRGSEQADTLRRAATVAQTQDYKSFEEEKAKNERLRQERIVAKAGKAQNFKDNRDAIGKITATGRYTTSTSSGSQGRPITQEVLVRDLMDFKEKMESGKATETDFKNLKDSTLTDELGNARPKQEIDARNAYISQVESSGFSFEEDSESIQRKIQEVEVKKEEKAKQGLDTALEDTTISNLRKRDKTLNQDYDTQILESDTRLTAKRERIDAAVSAAEGYNTENSRFLTEDPKIVTKTKSKTPEEMDSQVKRLQRLEETGKSLGDGAVQDKNIQRVEQDLKEGKQVLGKDGKIERVKMSPEEVKKAQEQLATFKEDKAVNTVARQKNKRETARLRASVAEDPVQYLKSLQKQRGGEAIQNTSRIDEDIKRSQDALKNGALGQGEDGKVKLTPLTPEERKSTEEYIKKRMADKKEIEAKNQPLIEIDNKIKAATAQAQMSDPKGYVELLKRRRGPSKGTPEDLKKGIQSKKDQIASLEKINPISDEEKNQLTNLEKETTSYDKAVSNTKELDVLNKSQTPLDEAQKKRKSELEATSMADMKLIESVDPKDIQSKKKTVANLKERQDPKEKIETLKKEIATDEKSLSQEQLIAEAQKKADAKDPAKVRASYVGKLKGSKDKNLQGVAAKIEKLDKKKAELESLKGSTLTVDDKQELTTLEDEVRSFDKAESNRKELDQLRQKASYGTLTKSDEERKKQLEETDTADREILKTEITPQKKARMQELQGKAKNTEREAQLKGEIKKGTEDVARATDENMGAINSELFKGQVAPIIMDQIQKPQDKAKVEAFNAKVVERQGQEAELDPVNKNIADIEAKRKERGKVANAAMGMMGEDKDGKKQEFINKFTRGEITAQEANEQTGGALKQAYDKVIPKKEGEKFEDLNNVGNIKDEKAKKALMEKNIAETKKEEDTLGAAIKPLIDAVANLTNAQGAVTEAAAAFQNAQGAQGAEGGAAAAATTNINSTSQVNVNITGEGVTPEIIEKLKPAILAIVAEHNRAAASEAGKPPPASPPPKSPPVTTP